MRYLLIFVLALSAPGLLAGCSYNKLYKNYNDYQDPDDAPQSKQTTKTAR